MKSLFVVALFISQFRLSGTILRVDDDAVPGGDGTSWALAFQHLQDALAVATAGDEIWLAAGTYYPDEGAGQIADSESAEFSLTSAVSLFGGFSGDETSRTNRDPKNNLSVLSGDITQNDVPESSFPQRSPNSYRLIHANFDGEAIIDGIKLYGALQPSSVSAGAGLLHSNGSLRLKNCHFFELRGRYGESSGAGITTVSDGLSVVNCIFDKCSTYLGGGAIAIHAEASNTTIFSCEIKNSSSSSDGGAIICYSSSASIANSLFRDNSAGGEGGALAIIDCSPDIAFCTFTTNSATDEGGAIYCESAGASFRSCVIWNNETYRYPDSFSDPSLTIKSNSTAFPSFQNTIIEHGFSDTGHWQFPLAIDLGGNSSENPEFSNPNSVILEGNDFPYFTPLSRTVRNSSFMEELPVDSFDCDNDGNFLEAIPYDLAGNPRLEGDQPEPGAFENHGPSLSGSLNPELLPEFENPVNLGSLTEVFAEAESFEILGVFPNDFILPSLSSIEANLILESVADTWGEGFVFVKATDSEGRESVQAVSVILKPIRLYVDDSASGSDSGLSWGNAMNDLYAAIKLTGEDFSPQEVWVAEGHYVPLSNTLPDYAQNFYVRNSADLVGGFAGHEISRNQSAPDLYPTVLSGDLFGDDVDANGDGVTDNREGIVGTNANAVVSIGDSRTEDSMEVTLEGFTITGGSSPDIYYRLDDPISPNINGGGIFTSEKLTLKNCRLVSNQAIGRGGALHVINGAEVDIENCIFQENYSEFQGGALACNGDSHITVTGSQFLANTTQTQGGAVYIYRSELLIDGCLFAGNVCEYSHPSNSHSSLESGGGAVAITNPRNSLFKNTLFHGNSCTQGALGNQNRSGGILLSEFSIWNPDGEIEFQNCTLAGNTNFDLLSTINNRVALNNSIVRQASIPTLFETTSLSNSTSIDSLFQEAIPSSQPTLAGNYRLLPNSIAVNKGTPSLAANLYSDIFGNPRHVGVVDIGAYEVQAHEFDQDGDGLPDDYELAHTIPASATDLNPASNLDGDPFNVGEEFALGYSLTEDEEEMPLGLEKKTIDGIQFWTLEFPFNPEALGFFEGVVENSIDLGSASPWTQLSTAERIFSEVSGQWIQTLLIPVEEAQEKNFYRLCVQQQ